MANRSAHAMRMALKRPRKSGDMPQLLRILWQAVLEARAILEAATEDQAELKLRAIHALSQSCGQYAKLLASDETDARLEALGEGLSGVLKALEAQPDARPG
jgi:hypothetical protein